MLTGGDACPVIQQQFHTLWVVVHYSQVQGTAALSIQNILSVPVHVNRCIVGREKGEKDSPIAQNEVHHMQ